MNSSGKTKNIEETGASPKPDCRAEFIFYAKTRSDEARPVKILGDYACDFRRPDWERRWSEWRSQNIYLNLFLCRDHAKLLGLLDDDGQSTLKSNPTRE